MTAASLDAGDKPSSETDGRGFLAGFLWGAATAAHQVEGANVHSDWWEYELRGELPEVSGEACRHLELYESDFDMAQGWGHNAHRLSIEWSRIEPAQGHFDAEALGHYRRMIAALRARSIEPVVTLHHFTNPAWLTRGGGWLRPDVEARFLRFVEHLVGALNGEVRYWLTINEPTVYAKHAYVVGDWPPCVRGSWGSAGRVIHRMCRAHLSACQLIHRIDPEARVGMAHSAPWIMPRDPGRLLDRWVAWSRDQFLNGIVLRMATRKVPGGPDFIGVNYYNRNVVAFAPKGLGWIFGIEPPAEPGCMARRYSDTGQEIYPEGLTATIRRVARYGLPIMITENGLATTDEELRCTYLREHVAALANAVAEGHEVLGYIYWTLMDNFEWALGRGARFGLAETDFTSQKRTERPAALLLAEICAGNRVV